MRWIVLTLVLANAVFFSWQYIVPPVNSSGLEQEVPESVGFEDAASHDQSSLSITLLEEIKPSATEGKLSSILANEAICYWAGPVEEGIEVELLVGRLKGLQVEASQYVERVDDGSRWWVLLPPLASRALAAQELQKLQSLGYDSYLITKGSRANGISLGLYTQEYLANKKVEQMKRAGWGAITDVYTKTLTQSWLSIDKNQLDAVGEGILPRMLKNKSGIQILEKKCELPVASHNNIH